jgi:hypothetical protein
MATGAEEQFAPYAVVRRSATPSAPRGVIGRPRYSKPEILEAMRAWAGRYGAPPTVVDWEPSRARRLGQAWRAARFESGEWPTARMVRGQFGWFNAAVEEAGLPARRRPSRVVAQLTGPEAILAAFVEWTRRYGDVPTLADWDPPRARRLGQEWRIARYHQGDWPSARTVANHFGSFSNAASAAGLLPRDRGRNRVDRSDQQATNRLTVARIDARSRRPGIKDLAGSLRVLAVARRTHDPVSLHAALIDVAAAALAWATILGSE